MKIETKYKKKDAVELVDHDGKFVVIDIEEKHGDTVYVVQREGHTGPELVVEEREISFRYPSK